MQVALVTGHEKIELREFPDPKPEPEKAVVEIAYCGICGTDLHAYHQGGPYNPAICGHEWAGTVSGVGSGVQNVREGDRVAIGVAPACGQCRECRAGDAAHCGATLMGMLGMGPLAASHGGFASAIAIEAARLYPLRSKISDVDAAMLEPATVAIHALRRTPLRLGDAVIVLGAGPIGLLVQQCAFIAGAGRVVVVEPEESRARLAASLGATAVVDPRDEDFEAKIRRVVGPLGADVVFECAGIPATIDQSVQLAKRGGVVSLVGLSTVPAEIAPGSWLAREVRLVASLGYLHDEFAVSQQLVDDGRLKLEALHTSTVGLDEIEPAFRRLLSGDGAVKILVDPRRA
jgi:(R,R)-butanediol dehydrogenase/meso-butanediol dehydrogenase/diacetyl reductase